MCSIEMEKEHNSSWEELHRSAMVAVAMAFTVAVLYDGDERPGMVGVVAAVRGGGGGVLHLAFDRTNS
jgi:hypothetical protein